MTFSRQWGIIQTIPKNSQEDPPLKKLHETVERFCVRHPRFGISNLMRYIVIGTAAIFLLQMFVTDATALNFLYFDLQSLLRGEIWRLVTFLFVPNTNRPFMLLIELYFYYWIGSTLERQWGTAKFNLYYFSGVLLTVIAVSVASLLSGQNMVISGTYYINLSMFLAFACLFPDTQVLLFFILPIKMKWLAIADVALVGYDVITYAVQGKWYGVIQPLIALLNFAVFIYPEVHYLAERRRYQHRPQTVNFKKAVKQQQQEKGYIHKCAVCGKTDTDYPDLDFRYCSKCAGYHCFCADHIFTHVHFTEE